MTLTSILGDVLPNTTSTASSAQTSLALPDPNRILPPNNNPMLHTSYGDLVLYTPTLILMAGALGQQTIVYGLLALLRNFNFHRMLDLTFLATVFSLTFVAAPLIFLYDLHIDVMKLYFFLEHASVEFLIAIRVFFRPTCGKHPGKVILGCWFGISALSIVVACNWLPNFEHGADVVAWTAFCSDFSVSLAGARLIFSWFKTRRARRQENVNGFGSPRDHLRRKLAQAEAMAGLGFMLHGITTMSVGPVFTRVLYKGENVAAFADTWVAVFAVAFVTVGLCTPAISIFFSTINWCCAHNRKVLPGQATYNDLEDEELTPAGGSNTRVDRAHNVWEKWSDSNDDSYKVSAVGPNGVATAK